MKRKFGIWGVFVWGELVTVVFGLLERGWEVDVVEEPMDNGIDGA